MVACNSGGRISRKSSSTGLAFLMICSNSSFVISVRSIGMNAQTISRNRSRDLFAVSSSRRSRSISCSISCSFMGFSFALRKRSYYITLPPGIAALILGLGGSMIEQEFLRIQERPQHVLERHLAAVGDVAL